MTCPCLTCARRRRQRIKAAILAAVVLLVCVPPFLGLTAFLYVWGAVTAVVGLVALGIALEFWRGFRAFEEWTAEQARRITGREPKPFARIVRR